ncbi:MAG: Asp-tRNA(Asn)/Glu-tRNA(Gln) amidotransferase subunit GatA [Gaiellales bacterium]
MSVDTLGLTAERAIALMDAGDVSCRELVTAYLDRIDEVNDGLNVYLRTRRDAALAEADRFDREGRDGLQGIPVALKDILCTRGEETTAGSRILAGHRPIFDGGCVTRVKEAGLISLGKTNMDEFAMGSSTENSAYGVTRNPWDPTRVPGGSSGGSAAAVAAGLAPLALGTDTGGSIRQPAALCGVVGMKPTYGAVSRYGLIAFASSLDQIGPFALTVRVAARLLAAMGGQDPCDATTIELPQPIAVPDRLDLGGVRIGIPADLLAQGVEPGVRTAFDAAVKQAEGLGAELVEISLPHAGHALPAYYLIAPAEASANLARFDGVRFGLRLEEPGDSVVDMYGRTRAAGFGAEVKRRIMLGTYALSAGYYDAYYGMAQKVRTMIRHDFDQAFQGVDVIATPTSPTVAFGIGERVDDPWAMYASDVLTVPVNLAGLPGISIPCGLAGGLPVGLQLIGPVFSENRLLEAAHAVEQAVGFDPKPPSVRGVAA